MSAEHSPSLPKWIEDHKWDCDEQENKLLEAITIAIEALDEIKEDDYCDTVYCAKEALRRIEGLGK